MQGNGVQFGKLRVNREDLPVFILTRFSAIHDVFKHGQSISCDICYCEYKMKQNPSFNITSGAVRDLCAESPRARLLHRLHSVALVAYGLSASEVARIFDDSPRAVAYWVKRFKQHGLAGLEEESKPGRPSKLAPAQMKKLQAFVNRSKRTGKPVKAETLVDFISKEFRIALTIRQCWRILKRLKA